jgi:hypothetical protein
MKQEVVKVVAEFDKVIAKSSQRTVEVKRNSVNSGAILTFKGLVANVGPESAVSSTLSDCGLVKTTKLGLTTESLLELYVVIQTYIDVVLADEVSEEKPKKVRKRNN